MSSSFHAQAGDTDAREARSSPGGARLCTKQTDRKISRYLDTAEELHAEIGIKSDGYSAMKELGHGHVQQMLPAERKQPDGKGCVLYDSICKIFSQRQNVGERSQRWLPGPGREGVVVKGGHDYKSRQKLGGGGGSSVPCLAHGGGYMTVSDKHTFVKTHRLQIVSQQKRLHCDEFRKMLWGLRKGK